MLNRYEIKLLGLEELQSLVVVVTMHNLTETPLLTSTHLLCKIFCFVIVIRCVKLEIFFIILKCL